MGREKVVGSGPVLNSFREVSKEISNEKEEEPPDQRKILLSPSNGTSQKISSQFSKFQIPIFKTEVLIKKAKEFLPGGTPGKLRREFNVFGPLVIKEAHGAYIEDISHKKYIDYHMAFGAIVLGHSDPDVVHAVQEQAEKLILHGAGITDLEVLLAEKLCKLVPSAEQVTFVNSGSEAVMLAMRVARGYTGRPIIIKFDGNYHGWHDYSLYNCGTSRKKGKKVETDGIPEHVQETIEVLPFNNEEIVEKYMELYGENVAGMIVEPVAHNIGAVPAKRSFLQKLREVADRYGCVLIFDEILTGIRHNIHCIQSEVEVIPDLTTIGKAVANGMPLAVLAGKKEIMELLADKVVISGTFSAHPLSVIASLVTLEKIEKLNVDRYIARLGQRHAEVLENLVKEYDLKAYVSSFRSIFSIYFGLTRPPVFFEDILKINTSAYKTFARVLREEGILISPNPRKRFHICFSHGEKELERFERICRKAIEEVWKNHPELRAH